MSPFRYQRCASLCGRAFVGAFVVGALVLGALASGCKTDSASSDADDDASAVTDGSSTDGRAPGDGGEGDAPFVPSTFGTVKTVENLGAFPASRAVAGLKSDGSRVWPPKNRA